MLNLFTTFCGCFSKFPLLIYLSAGLGQGTQTGLGGLGGLGAGGLGGLGGLGGAGGLTFGQNKTGLGAGGLGLGLGAGGISGEGSLVC